MVAGRVTGRSPAVTSEPAAWLTRTVFPVTRSYKKTSFPPFRSIWPGTRLGASLRNTIYRPSALSFGTELPPLAESEDRPGGTRVTSSIWPAQAAGRPADSRAASTKRSRRALDSPPRRHRNPRVFATSASSARAFGVPPLYRKLTRGIRQGPIPFRRRRGATRFAARPHRHRPRLRRSSGSLASGSQGRQHRGDEEQHRHVTPEVAAMLALSQRLDGHDPAVHHARPDREPDQTEARERIPGRQEQEDAQGGVDSDDHQGVVGISRVPRPAGRPDDHERVDAHDRDDADDDQHDLQSLETSLVAHGLLLNPWPWRAVLPPSRRGRLGATLFATTSSTLQQIQGPHEHSAIGHLRGAPFGRHRGNEERADDLGPGRAGWKRRGGPGGELAQGRLQAFAVERTGAPLHLAQQHPPAVQGFADQIPFRLRAAPPPRGRTPGTELSQGPFRRQPGHLLAAQLLPTLGAKLTSPCIMRRLEPATATLRPAG